MLVTVNFSRVPAGIGPCLTTFFVFQDKFLNFLFVILHVPLAKKSLKLYHIPRYQFPQLLYPASP
jgi:hypothetical protein